MGLSIIGYGPFWCGCKILETSFCVDNFAIKTYLQIFKFVAEVNREFILELMSCLCNSFFLTFWKISLCFFISV